MGGATYATGCRQVTVLVLPEISPDARARLLQAPSSDVDGWFGYLVDF